MLQLQKLGSKPTTATWELKDKRLDLSDRVVKKKPKNRRKKSKKSDKVKSLFYININGYTSKRDSMKDIIQRTSPDIIVLCETKVGSKKKWNIENYESVSRNCSFGKGGILVAAKYGTYNSFLEVTKSKNDGILVARMEYGKRVIRIVAVYGPQETSEKEVKEDFYNDLNIEIECGKYQDEEILIIGDLNGKLDLKGGIIKSTSDNGEQIMKTVEKHNLKVINFCDVTNGKWTRISKDESQKSVLDYVISSENFEKGIIKLDIDEEKLFCPFKVTHKKKELSCTYSDHCAMRLSFKIDHKITSFTEKKTNWKISTSGLKRFKHLTEEGIQIDRNSQMQENYSMLENQINSIMKTCFKKSKFKINKKDVKIGGDYERFYAKLKKLLQEGKTQRNIAKDYLESLKNIEVEKSKQRNYKKVKDTILSLTENEKFNHRGFWKLKKSLKSDRVVPSSVIKNEIEYFDKGSINKIYKEEFEQRLKPNKTDEDFDVYQEKTEMFIQLCLEIAKRSKTQKHITVEEVKRAIKTLKAGKAPGPDDLPTDILLNAGKSLIVALTDIFEMIWQEGQVPKQWNDVKIKTLFKNKGSKKRLENYRGIFLTSVVSKVFEKLVKNRIQEKLKDVHKFQAGCQPNRSTADNIFLLRGCIDHHKYYNKCLYLTLYDVKQCFDKLWLGD